MKAVRMFLVVAACAAMISCVSFSGYYKVTDTVNGTEYYTKRVKSLRGGAIRFKDASTGATVRLEKHSVENIEKDEFSAGRN